MSKKDIDIDTNNESNDKSKTISINKRFSIFTDPNDNCMSYLDHLGLSLSFSRKLLVSSWKAVVHAFIPSLYVTSTTQTVMEIQDLLLKNSCREYYKWNKYDILSDIDKNKCMR